MSSLYRSSAGRAAILNHYAARLDALALPVTRRFVKTPLGRTHVLLAGHADGPPLVLVPGTGGGAIDLAQAWPHFAAHHRCVFVDVPGQPNHSAEEPVDKAGDGLGRWMAAVLDALGIARAAMIGMSGGGYVILRAATVIPERIPRAALFVPEGFTRPHLRPMLGRVLWPMLRYRLRPTEAHLRRALLGITAGEALPAEAHVGFGLNIRHVKGGPSLGPLFSVEELAGWDAPVFLVAGGADPIFPGEPLVAGARRVLRGPLTVELIPDAGHLSAQFVGGPILDRATAFLRTC